MLYTHLLLLFNALVCGVAARESSTTTDALSIPASEVSELLTSFTPVAVAAPGALQPESRCAGNRSLTNFCPSCDGSVIPYGRFGAYEVTCGAVYANVSYLYFDTIHSVSVTQCIQACQDMGHCYSPVISPSGECLLSIVSPGEEPTLATEDGFAALQPRFTGALPPSSASGVGSYLSTTTHTKTRTSLNPAKTCPAAEITCPHCNGAHVKDPLGTTYKVLCDDELYSDSHYSVQRWLTAEGCMAECDQYDWCKGSTFWPEGNCELARGEQVFLQRQVGHIAFLPVNSSQTPPPTQLSSYPTESVKSISTPSLTARPSLAKCNRKHIKCPHCNGFELSDGLHSKYRVQCDLRPSCAEEGKIHKHSTVNSCLEKCDKDQTCRAAVFERGTCVLCRGVIETFAPYHCQHEYVLFVAESAVKNITNRPSAVATSGLSAYSFSLASFHTSWTGTHPSWTQTFPPSTLQSLVRTSTLLSRPTRTSSSSMRVTIGTAISLA